MGRYIWCSKARGSLSEDQDLIRMKVLFELIGVEFGRLFFTLLDSGWGFSFLSLRAMIRFLHEFLFLHFSFFLAFQK